LIVQDGGGGLVIPCSPDQGEKVRQFALNLMASAPRAPQAAEARRRLLEEAEPALRAARSDTGNLESSRAALERVEAERLALPPAPESVPGAAATPGGRTVAPGSMPGRAGRAQASVTTRVVDFPGLRWTNDSIEQ
jgi:hypothetical protein